MVYSRTQWRSWHSGAVINALFNQLGDFKNQYQFCRHMIRAALELLVLGLHRNGKLWSREKLLIHEETSEKWCVVHPSNRQGFRLHFVPQVNDQQLWQWRKDPLPYETTIVVPPGTGFVFEHALHDVLQDRTPPVHSLDDFICLRVMLSSMDAGWTREKTIMWLVLRYNSLVRMQKHDRRLLVKLRD